MTLVLTAAASGSQVEPTAGAESTSAVSNTVTHPSAVATELVDGLNPIAMAEDAMGAIPGFEGGLSTAINIVILMTVLTLSPAVLVMCTCFTRIIIVLGLLRQAMGTHSMPPAQIITGISLFMTFLIMAPTAERVWHEAIQPYQAGDPAVASQMDVWNRARIPIRDFMFDQIDATDNWDSVYVLLEYRGYDVSDPSKLTLDDVDMLTLVPAFIMSELKVAFMIGFRIYLPFLVIDMIIASLLISMGMMMLPPVLISLPFKLLLFVLVDGWDLLISSLLMGFAQRTPAPDAEAMHIIEETGRFAVNVLSVAGWA
ncbi:MAG: flagellar type III secretion system pore protein FliP [Planctomycetota bacterium]